MKKVLIICTTLAALVMVAYAGNGFTIIKHDTNAQKVTASEKATTTNVQAKVVKKEAAQTEAPLTEEQATARLYELRKELTIAKENGDNALAESYLPEIAALKTQLGISYRQPTRSLNDVGGDLCANAYDIGDVSTALPFLDSGTPGQTDEVTSIPCASGYGAGNDRWYKFTVPDDGVQYCLTFEMSTLPDFQFPVIAVYDGCGGNCLVGTENSNDAVIPCTTFGPGTYYIICDNWPTPALTHYDLTVSACACPAPGRCCYYDATGAEACEMLPQTNCEALADYYSWDAALTCNDPCDFPAPCPDPGPVSDDCLNPVPLPVPGSASGSTVGLAASTAPSCGYSQGTGGSAWYSVIGTGGQITITTCSYCTDFDTKLHVYACTCDNLLCITANDDDYSGRFNCSVSGTGSIYLSTVTWCSVAGEQYYVLVGGFSTNEGNFLLTSYDDGVCSGDPVGCPTTGACCYQDYTCDEGMTQADCEAAGGTYLGDGSTCDLCQAPCPYESLDNEPNDDCAGRIPNVECGTSYCGEISDGTDVDWYQVVIPEGVCKSLTLNVFGDDSPCEWAYNQGLDPAVELWTGDCATQLSPTAYGSWEDVNTSGTCPAPEGFDASWTSGCLTAGIYRIKVETNYSAPGPYVLQVLCTDCPCPGTIDCENDFQVCGSPAEVEPNDACGTGLQALTCDDEMYGKICPFDEHDWFQLDVPANSIISVDFADGDGCTNVPTQCVAMDLYLDCQTTLATGLTGGFSLNNAGGAASSIFLDLYSPLGDCISTYHLSVSCCAIRDCSNPIYVEVPADGHYNHTENSCCWANTVPFTFAVECTGSNYTSGPAVIYLLDVSSPANISEIDVTGGDTQFMIFTDCNDPTGSCVASEDAGVAETGGPYNLAPGIYYLSTSFYGANCGDLTLDIYSDNPLAVELTSFDAIAGDREVSLTWTTASEHENDHFEVVRDGETVANITATNLTSGDTYHWTDNDVVNGTTYSYSLVGVDVNGNRATLSEEVNTTPSVAAATVTEYALHQNFPNPFNPETNISFDMVDAGFVNLSVYNLLGQKVATVVNGTMEAGRHIVNFDGANLPSGLYIYRMETSGFSAQKKMVLMK